MNVLGLPAHKASFCEIFANFIAVFLIGMRLKFETAPAYGKFCIHLWVVKKTQQNGPRDSHYSSHLNLENHMNVARLFCLSCCLFVLQGCFDNSDNETKDNTDGTKSSVQMQEKGDK